MERSGHKHNAPTVVGRDMSHCCCSVSPSPPVVVTSSLSSQHKCAIGIKNANPTSEPKTVREIQRDLGKQARRLPRLLVALVLACPDAGKNEEGLGVRSRFSTTSTTSTHPADTPHLSDCHSMDALFSLQSCKAPLGGQQHCKYPCRRATGKRKRIEQAGGGC